MTIAIDSTRTLEPLTCELRDRILRFEDDPDPFIRALITGRVYRECKDWPMVRVRAEVTARVLEQIDIPVLSEERLIGPTWRRFRVHGGIADSDGWRLPVAFPERFMPPTGFSHPEIPAEVKEELAELASKAPWHEPLKPIVDRSQWITDAGLGRPWGKVFGHTLPYHGILLEAGIGELRRKIGRYLDMESTEAQRDQWLAMDRVLKSLATYTMRCADAAEKATVESDDPVMVSLLRQAAENCRHVASERPETFAQALQLLQFSNFVDVLDTPGDASSYGRVDQYLYPLYLDDLKNQRLTSDEAFDLVCHFLIKGYRCRTSANMTVGGVTCDGDDATNELSTMFLEAMETTGLVTDLSVRLHSGSPESFVRTVARVVRRGFGRPSIWNDEMTVKALAAHDVELADARDYAPLGCAEIMIPGRTTGRTMCLGLNASKLLELTINRGCGLLDGKAIWKDVPGDFESYEILVDEYHRRMQDFIGEAVEIIRMDERAESQTFPRPWLSVLSRGGIDAGVDMTAGQPKYNCAGVTLDGLADVCNSLLAIRTLVFEEKRITLDELRKILADDWAGEETLRQYVVNRMSRFGQDQEDIKEIASSEAAHFADCFAEFRTAFDGRFWPMIFGVTTNVFNGKRDRIGATPGGRRTSDMLTISLQPASVGGRGCPTELLSAIADIDFTKYPGGVSNVQDLDPSLFQGDDGLDRLVSLILGFFEMGGMELGLNFVDEAMLRAAQKNPDQHSHLMVRLFGLSAQFVTLSKPLQEHVIERIAAAGGRR